MTFVLSALVWLVSPENYVGSGSIPQRIGEHLYYTLLSVAIASALALPLGFLIGHTGRGRQFVIGFTGAMRALPTLGLVSFLALFAGIGLLAPTIAFVILAIPPVLAGAYAGIESVERSTVDAARATGLTELQILTRVEIPLALPLIIGGIRSASLQVIATATIAYFVGLGGLGRIIGNGIGLADNDRLLGGAILVTLLALAVDLVFALIQRATSVGGFHTDGVKKKKDVRDGSLRPIAAVKASTDERK